MYALSTLLFLDELKESRENEQSLKRALAARPDFDVKKLFPEWFPEEKKENVGLPPNDISQDYDKVEWKSPKDAAEEWERLSKILAQRQGFMTGDDVVEMPTTADIQWSDWQ